MIDISSRARARMSMVLEEICNSMPNGGDHESRKSIAMALFTAFEAGHQTADELRLAARNALAVLEAEKR